MPWSEELVFPSGSRIGSSWASWLESQGTLVALQNQSQIVNPSTRRHACRIWCLDFIAHLRSKPRFGQFLGCAQNNQVLHVVQAKYPPVYSFGPEQLRNDRLSTFPFLAKIAANPLHVQRYDIRVVSIDSPPCQRIYFDLVTNCKGSTIGINDASMDGWQPWWTIR